MDTPTNQPTPASGGDQPTPTPAPAGDPTPGGAGGTQAPAGFVPQSELDRAEAARRELQSKLDKAHAELKSKAEPPKPATAPETPADPAAMFQEFERRMELREAKAAFRADEALKDADPALFNRATEFDSVEAFRAALEASAESRKAERDRIKAEVEAQIRADYEAKYGKLDNTPPSPNGGGAPDGEMTLERLMKLPQAEFEAFASANPEAYERLLASTA